MWDDARVKNPVTYCAAEKNGRPTSRRKFEVYTARKSKGIAARERKSVILRVICILICISTHSYTLADARGARHRDISSTPATHAMQPELCLLLLHGAGHAPPNPAYCRRNRRVSHKPENHILAYTCVCAQRLYYCASVAEHKRPKTPTPPIGTHRTGVFPPPTSQNYLLVVK